MRRPMSSVATAVRVAAAKNRTCIQRARRAAAVSATSSTLEYVEAGCVVCHGPHRPGWVAANAMAVAARHHQATGHPTWARQTLRTDFGDAAAAPAQLPGIDPLTGASSTSG